MALNRSIFVVISALALAVISDVMFVLRTAVIEIASFARNVVAGPVSMIEPDDVLPLRQVQRADQFVQRIIKRDRPVISASWRMCPSV